MASRDRIRATKFHDLLLTEQLEVFLAQMLHLCSLVNQVDRRLLIVLLVIQIGLSLDRHSSRLFLLCSITDTDCIFDLLKLNN